MICRLHGALAASVVRDSASAVHHELLECYTLIEKLGRGVVYYGSARLKQDSPHWGRAVELGRQVAELLGCTTWSGGGPGIYPSPAPDVVTVGTMLNAQQPHLRHEAALSSLYMSGICRSGW